MIGLGTVINTAAVLAGGFLGLLLKNGIAKKYETILMQAAYWNICWWWKMAP